MVETRNVFWVKLGERLTVPVCKSAPILRRRPSGTEFGCGLISPVIKRLGGGPQHNAFWILFNISHFKAALATQPPENQSQIVCEGRCQIWSRLLASNDLKCRREFSFAPQNCHHYKMWTKVVDHNGRTKFELTTINPCHLHNTQNCNKRKNWIKI